MLIGGLQKTSFIDYPGQIAAVIFSRGCNFRCPYCHNPELVDPQKYGQELALEELETFLRKRKGLLDAVVVTGGEPTLQVGLYGFLQKIKEMGYLIKIDTNGSRPEVLEKLLADKLIDYIAMDVKAPLAKYRKVTGVEIEPAQIHQSIQLIKKGSVKYEFRTTCVKGLLTEEDILEIGELLYGAEKYVLQSFVPTKVFLPEMLLATSYSEEELLNLQAKLSSRVRNISIR